MKVLQIVDKKIVTLYSQEVTLGKQKNKNNKSVQINSIVLGARGKGQKESIIPLPNSLNTEMPLHKYSFKLGKTKNDFIRLDFDLEDSYSTDVLLVLKPTFDILVFKIPLNIKVLTKGLVLSDDIRKERKGVYHYFLILKENQIFSFLTNKKEKYYIVNNLGKIEIINESEYHTR